MSYQLIIGLAFPVAIYAIQELVKRIIENEDVHEIVLEDKTGKRQTFIAAKKLKSKEVEKLINDELMFEKEILKILKEISKEIDASIKKGNHSDFVVQRNNKEVHIEAKGTKAQANYFIRNIKSRKPKNTILITRKIHENLNSRNIKHINSENAKIIKRETKNLIESMTAG